MRRLIAALQVSVDGFIEGPDGEIDWVGTWEDSFDLLPQVDTFVLGGGMYPGYERYWLGHTRQPRGRFCPSPAGRPTKGEVEYARFADKTPHVVLSKTMEQRLLEDGADSSGCGRDPSPEGSSRAKTCMCSAAPRSCPV